MTSIESYTIGIILLLTIILSNLLLALITGGRRKNILKTDFWIIFGISIILTIIVFTLIISNTVDLSIIYNNELFKSVFNLNN